jgi:hypothetical protein
LEQVEQVHLVVQLKEHQDQIQFLQIHHHQLHRQVEEVAVVVVIQVEQLVVQVEEEDQIKVQVVEQVILRQ